MLEDRRSPKLSRMEKWTVLASIVVWWIKSGSTWCCWQRHHSNRKAGSSPFHLGTAGGRWTFIFLYLSAVLPADTSSVSGCHVLFKAPIISMLNIITQPVNMRAGLNKEYFTLPWLEKAFCHGLSTLIPAPARPWRLYSVWQRRARDSFSWHPRTSPHCHPPLKYHINSNKVLPYRSPWRPELLEEVGGGGGRHPRLNDRRQWWCRWCSVGTSCPQALG